MRKFKHEFPLIEFNKSGIRDGNGGKSKSLKVRSGGRRRPQVGFGQGAKAPEAEGFF